jgi:hypothetical protein
MWGINMIKNCNDCEFKRIGTKNGDCKYWGVTLHEPPLNCNYGVDEKEKLRRKEAIEEMKNRYQNGEKVYHKSIKKYAIYDETDINDCHRAYVYLLNDDGSTERKRVTLDLLKREIEV